MAKKTEVLQSQETLWLGKYRPLIQRIIYLCNMSATKFAIPIYYDTDYKLTGIQFQIIEYTLEGKHMKMTAIADRLGITRGALSNNVKKLESLGLLYKEHRGSNKKDLYLVITEKGLGEYRKYANCVYEQALRDVFEIADTIPEKYIKTFEHLLEVYAENLI